MQEKYPCLNDLISSNYKAKEYFMSLPDYVQGQMMQRTQSVNSFESLRDYAENLLRGDD